MVGGMVFYCMGVVVVVELGRNGLGRCYVAKGCFGIWSVGCKGEQNQSRRLGLFMYTTGDGIEIEEYGSRQQGGYASTPTTTIGDGTEIEVLR